LSNILTGSDNIAIGNFAGFNYQTNDNNNICIGNQGSAGETGAIRIGTLATHTSLYVPVQTIPTIDPIIFNPLYCNKNTNEIVQYPPPPTYTILSGQTPTQILSYWTNNIRDKPIINNTLIINNSLYSVTTGGSRLELPSGSNISDGTRFTLIHKPTSSGSIVIFSISPTTINKPSTTGSDRVTIGTGGIGEFIYYSGVWFVHGNFLT
jgi:hypothetical protein